MIRRHHQSPVAAAVCAALIAMLPAAVGSAATEDKTVAEKLLDILHEDERIDEAQYEELSKQAQEEKQPDPEDYKVYWKDNLRIERNDGMFKYKIGGRIHFDFASVMGDDIASYLETRYGDDYRSGFGTGVEFRRARIMLSGEVWKRAIFKIDLDFATPTRPFRSVYMGLKGLGPLGTFYVGQFKEPFSLEEMGSSNYVTFLERSLIASFNETYNPGVMFANHVLDQRMTWAVGGFHDGLGISSEGRYHLTGRVTGLPLRSDDGRHLVHLGFSYSHNFRDGEAKFNQRPESHLAANFIRIEIPDATGVDIFKGEFAWGCGPFSLQSEVAGALVSRRSGGDLSYWGAYAFVSYFLTGEHRPYDGKRGAFTRVRPNNSFDPKNGHWGAWEVAFRGSYLDGDSLELAAGRMLDFTVGLNWYLFSNTRIMANYVNSQLMVGPLDNLDPANIFQMRFQIDF